MAVGLISKDLAPFLWKTGSQILKKIMSIVITISVVIPFTSGTGSAVTGGMDSGGGLGIACFINEPAAKKVRDQSGSVYTEDFENIISLDPLDHYFANLPRGMEAELPELIPTLQGESPWSYAERVIAKISAVLPSLGNDINNSRIEFIESEIVWQEAGVISMNDIGHPQIVLEPHCAYVTIAYQYVYENVNYLLIDPRLFSHSDMDVRKQGVLLLHEYLYLVARKSGQSNSHNTRLMLSYLLRTHGQVSVFDLAEKAQKLKFLDTSYPAITSVSLIQDLIEQALLELEYAFANFWSYRINDDQAASLSYLHDDLVAFLQKNYGDSYTTILQQSEARMDEAYLQAADFVTKSLEDQKYRGVQTITY